MLTEGAQGLHILNTLKVADMLEMKTCFQKSQYCLRNGFQQNMATWQFFKLETFL